MSDIAMKFGRFVELQRRKQPRQPPLTLQERHELEQLEAYFQSGPEYRKPAEVVR